MKELVEFLAKNIVDNPDSVSVSEEKQNGSTLFKLAVEENDMGKIIGKNGRVIRAIRSLLKIKAIKDGSRAFLTIQDPNQ
jgi:predicted RNA-binding protein YlqC (UPF0109 family)